MLTYKKSIALCIPCWLYLLLQIPVTTLAMIMRSSSGDLPFSPPVRGPAKVLVTGASGRTGRLVFAKLLRDPRFEPHALVRSERSAKRLIKAVKGTGLDSIIICDVTTMKDIQEQEQDEEEEEIPTAGLQGTTAMIICTSAVVRVRISSIIKMLLKIPWKCACRKKKLFDFRSLRFGWKYGQYPEQVDYEGQVAQIEFAKSLGIDHVVLVSSMGGSDPNNFLNSAGKNADGSGNGDILIWKRRAEKYLVESGLYYTILHPGGLNDKDSGMEQFHLDVDDNLWHQRKSISRGDVADLCVAALTVGKDKKVSFDCVTSAPVDGEVSVSLPKRADEALAEFLKEGKTCTYSL